MSVNLVVSFDSNPAFLIALAFLLVAIGVATGYLIGNISLRKRLDVIINTLTKYKMVQSSIIDNVNLGVIAYNSEGYVYVNETIGSFPGFLKSKESIPRDINAFLEAYDQDNHLKANYMLNLENDDIEIRANYIVNRRIYEIKILHRYINDDRLDIVIVDDITRIKDDERRQKDLAANVSHELKTPLTVIRASEFFVNNIRPDSVPSYEEVKKWGTRIVTNAVRMQDIVQDFLILSMCSNNVPMTILDANEIVNKALLNISDYPNRDRVQINFPENPATPLIYGNSNLVMRVIINLLTNSVKYIDYDGKAVPHEINVSISPLDGSIAIQVADNGRGIPKESIDHLFERFYRVDNSGSRDVGGSGIGLAIAKEVADMHDGTINVVSDIGQGSTFTFVIPTAETVFMGIFDDAKTGVVSDNQYYLSATNFMAMHTAEAVKSMGYEDVYQEVADYEAVGEGEKSNHDKALISLLMKLGKERYDELVEELIFVEEDFDDYDEGLDDDIDEDYEYQDEVAEEEAIPDPDEAERLERERLEQEAQKEEARRILTQTILPRSTSIVQEQPSQQSPIKENVTIHPNGTGKVYNRGSGKKKVSLFEGLAGRRSKPEQSSEHQSAVKKVLDEAETMVPPTETKN